MGLMLPLLGFAGLYVVSLFVDLYILVQLVLHMARKQKHQSWGVAWLISNVTFASGFLLRLAYPQVVPVSTPVILELVCFIATPFLLLVTLYKFKRASKKNNMVDNKQADLEREYILDIRHRDDVWPPPPK